ncbi:hypothetical protein PBY51_006494 [Eleginops maclovinus]|uniref:Uncharacterized protein n=1 Tax=Eleginops maclovinus TaxID=56733 RepID=A0AAN8AAA0_ELEMC|nr:hypothetical protein PBY51_006494 [Eleginops maclovinus]
MPHSVRMIGGGWTARYRSRNSPETKRLFFAATEEMCLFFSFIPDNRPPLPAFVFLVVQVIVVVRPDIQCYSFQIGAVTILVTNCKM